MRGQIRSRNFDDHPGSREERLAANLQVTRSTHWRAICDLLRGERSSKKRKMARSGGGDARDWDEEGYRSSILLERELRSRTVFRTAFAPSPNPNPNSQTLAVASSDGFLAAYSIPSCISAAHQNVHSRKKIRQEVAPDFLLAEPLCIIQGHKGPAYDLKFYGNGEESLLLSCGDDGHIRGWKWMDILNSEMPIASQEVLGVL